VREKLNQSIQRGRFSAVNSIPEKKPRRKPRADGEEGDEGEYNDGEDGSQGEGMDEQN
jgi:hypothetical protein